MPDLDDLLRPDVSDAAARAAREPAFDDVRRRGLARRRRSRIAVTGLAVVLVAAGAAGVALRPTGDPQRDPTTPSPSPSPSVDRSLSRGPSAKDIVDGSRSTLAWLTAVPGHDDVRAALWRQCDSKACNEPFHAIAVTRDGFRSRHLVRLPDGSFPRVEQVGDDAFSVTGAGPRPFLLHADGTRTRLGSPGAAAPLRSGEVVLNEAGATSDAVPVGVDPATGASHLLPSPGALQSLQATGGRLVGLLLDDTFVSSDDGGATWQRHPLPSGGARAVHQLVPSAATGLSAVLAGSDGATQLPLESVDRGDAGAWDTVTLPAQPRAYVDGAVVLPGGELQVFVTGWSDPHYQGGNLPPGLYVSNGSDWADLLRALPARPESPRMSETQVHRVQRSTPTLVGSTVGPGHATTYVSDGTETYAVTGSDAGTWAPVTTR